MIEKNSQFIVVFTDGKYTVAENTPSFKNCIISELIKRRGHNDTDVKDGTYRVELIREGLVKLGLDLVAVNPK